MIETHLHIRQVDPGQGHVAVNGKACLVCGRSMMMMIRQVVMIKNGSITFLVTTCLFAIQPIPIVAFPVQS